MGFIWLLFVGVCGGEAAWWSAVILLLTSLWGGERWCPMGDSSHHQGLLVCPRPISQLVTSGWCSQYAWGWRASALMDAILMATREGTQRQDLCSKTHREWQIYQLLWDPDWIMLKPLLSVMNQWIWQYPSFAELQLNDMHTHPYFNTQTHLCKPITLFSW